MPKTKRTKAVDVFEGVSITVDSLIEYLQYLEKRTDSIPSYTAFELNESARETYQRYLRRMLQQFLVSPQLKFKAGVEYEEGFSLLTMVKLPSNTDNVRIMVYHNKPWAIRNSNCFFMRPVTMREQKNHYPSGAFGYFISATAFDLTRSGSNFVTRYSNVLGGVKKIKGPWNSREIARYEALIKEVNRHTGDEYELIQNAEFSKHYVLEFQRRFQGESLQTFIDRHITAGRTLPVDMAMRISYQAVTQLIVLHMPVDGKIIVHHDVKPANMIYSEQKNVLKFTDYGIAQVAVQKGNQLMIEPFNGGTPCYLPPSDGVTYVPNQGPQGDVYALGKVIWQLLGATSICPSNAWENGTMPEIIPLPLRQLIQQMTDPNRNTRITALVVRDRLDTLMSHPDLQPLRQFELMIMDDAFRRSYEARRAWINLTNSSTYLERLRYYASNLDYSDMNEQMKALIGANSDAKIIEKSGAVFNSMIKFLSKIEYNKDTSLMSVLSAMLGMIKSNLENPAATLSLYCTQLSSSVRVYINLSHMKEAVNLRPLMAKILQNQLDAEKTQFLDKLRIIHERVFSDELSHSGTFKITPTCVNAFRSLFRSSEQLTPQDEDWDRVIQLFNLLHEKCEQAIKRELSRTNSNTIFRRPACAKILVNFVSQQVSGYFLSRANQLDTWSKCLGEEQNMTLLYKRIQMDITNVRGYRFQPSSITYFPVREEGAILLSQSRLPAASRSVPPAEFRTHF